MNTESTPRMHDRNDLTNPLRGTVVWSPVKSIWFTAHALVAGIGGATTFSPAAVGVAFVTTVTTLCLGHSVGFHRLIVHRSFECPRPVEYALVHLGTLVGMGGPLAILRMHDIRDWAQRHETCHPFYIDAKPAWRDALWQLHCDLRLDNPPEFRPEPRIRDDRVHRFMQATWMIQNVPLALLLYAVGGAGFVIWGVSVRITVSLLGHWLVDYLAHNTGEIARRQPDHAVQGRNVPYLGLLTMGEAHHNNHHAFPGSAKLGLAAGQPDPGWWAIRALRKLGRASGIRTPDNDGETREARPVKKRAPLSGVKARVPSRRLCFFTEP